MADTNSIHFDETIRLATLVGTNIKTARKNKQALYRSTVLEICVEDFDTKTTIDDIKRKAKYGAMDKADQALIRRELANVRKVVDNWPHFSDEQRNAFVNGEIASEDSKAFPDGDWPATLAVNSLAKHCTDRDKKADSSDVEDEKSEGTATPDATADDADTSETTAPECETFTLEQIVAMIAAGDERTLPIFEAVDAFNAGAIEESAAA